MVAYFTYLDKLNVASFVDRSAIYGPGERVVIWLQGCKLQCEGCWNKEFWSFEIKKLYSVEELFDRIVSVGKIDGVTILGGEPLHQAKPLLKLIKKLKSVNLSLMLYTGFEYEEIFSDPIKKHIFELSDIVIYGRYMKKLRSTYLPWRGSSNQVIACNNKKYEKIVNSQSFENQVEIHVNKTGEILLLGYPDDELKREVLL